MHAPEPGPAPPRALVHAQRALAVVACACALAVALTTVSGVLAGHHPIPFQDHWETVFEHEALLQGRFGPAQLWAQHNEHRLVLPRLVFLADYAWGEGRGWICVGAMLVLHAFELVLLVHVARWWTRPGSRTWWLFVGLSASLVFWAVHKGNLIFPFQVQMIGALAAASAAFACVGRACSERRRESRSLLAAGVLAALSTLCFASGLFVWPLCALLAWLGRARLRAVLVLGAAGLVVIALYLVGYHSPQQHASPLGALADPLFVLRYVARYLGSPLGPDHRVARELLGACGLASFLLVALVLARRRAVDPARALDPARGLGLGLAALVVATALVSALGRHELGLDSAMAPRYESFGALFWCALLVCAGCTLRERLQRGPLVAPAALVLAAAALALVGWRQRAEARALRDAYGWLDEAALALASGVVEEQHALCLYSWAEKLLAGDALLRARQLSLYAEPWARTVGAPLAAFGAPQAEAHAGQLAAQALRTFDGGAARSVEGWCSSLGADELAGPILLVDGAGLVVGLARLRRRRPAGRGWIAWTGFARGAGEEVGGLSAFALREDGALSELRVP